MLCIQVQSSAETSYILCKHKTDLHVGASGSSAKQTPKEMPFIQVP